MAEMINLSVATGENFVQWTPDSDISILAVLLASGSLSTDPSGVAPEFTGIKTMTSGEFYYNLSSGYPLFNGSGLRIPKGQTITYYAGGGGTFCQIIFDRVSAETLINQ